jgi:predicted alpha/beta-hydrolase family hydrolase
MGHSRLMVDTPSGPAQVDLDRPARGVRGLLVLGHGAGGGVDAPDLLAVRDAALDLGMAVARVTQPYRVAGRRAPVPAARLDQAWITVLADLRRKRGLARVPLVVGGRSSGARVACRTATVCGADAVVALAFPVHPPGKPDRSRLDELDAVTVPVLVIQGDRDPFGMPPRRRGRRVVTVAGDHSLRGDLRASTAAVGRFLDAALPQGRDDGG